MNNLAQQPGDTLPGGQYTNGLLILLNLLFVQEVLTLRVMASYQKQAQSLADMCLACQDE